MLAIYENMTFCTLPIIGRDLLKINGRSVTGKTAKLALLTKNKEHALADAFHCVQTLLLEWALELSN